MPKLLRLALPLAGALFLSACSQDRGSRNYDVQRYDLEAEYNWEKKCLSATVHIELLPGEDGLRDLDFDSAVNVTAVRIERFGDIDYEVQPDKHLWVSLADYTVQAGSPIVIEIDYEALPSDNLRPIGARQGDPVDIRAVYTDSEPQGVRQWMPSHDEPSDRAVFAAGLRMAPHETAIANGTLMADKMVGSSRYMRYETAYPLPTYLMAFAISEFEVHATKQGRTPVEVWHRKGVIGNHDVMAAELARMIGEMEAHFVPYPFERYALVLLPGHMVGGMENAGITFQRETSTTAPGLAGDLGLAAHELAHQWFGDLMTVQSWDDVWIKEGMASLLEEELVRSHLDADGQGTLNGHSYGVAEGQAIWDPTKLPKDKYDSGPYGRSAWFFTQIRRVVGDEAFFGTLRQLLETHRMGNVTTEDVVQAFAPAFEPLGADKLRRALAAKGLPHLVFSETEQTATLQDPDGALLAPFEYSWVGLDGMRHRQTLVRGELDALQSFSPDDLLVLDPDDVHPVWETFTDDGTLPDFITSRLLPTTPEQLNAFRTLSGTHQTLALSANAPMPWPFEPLMFNDFANGLHSDGAQAIALLRACEVGGDMPSPEWSDSIRATFSSVPTTFGVSAIGSYSSCLTAIGAPEPWANSWDKLATGLPNGDLTHEHLSFLTRVDTNHRNVWASVFENAGSLRTRLIAAGRVPTTLENHAHFVAWTQATDSSEVLRSSLLPRLGTTTRNWKTAWANGDASGEQAFEAGLSAIATVLKKDVTRPAHGYALCTVRNLLRDWQTVNGTDVLVFDSNRWTQFVAKLNGAPLSVRAQEIANAPEICN